jgi:fluoride exporter
MTSAVDPPLDPDLAEAASRPLLLTVIGVGGALGTLARYELGVHVRTAGDYGFSYATFIANVAGAFLLGLLVSLAARFWPRAHYLRPALGTGVLGGFTTFSTYMVETDLRLAHGHATVGLLYVLATLVCGLAAAYTGLVLGGRR